MQFLADRGLTMAEVIEVARLNSGQDTSTLERRRAYDRERKRKAKSGNSGGIPPEQQRGLSTGNSTGIPPETAPLACVELKPLKIITLAKTDDDETRARDQNDWPEGDARSHAAALVDLCATSKLDPQRKGGLVTSMGRIALWRRDGASWLFDVVPTVQALVAKAKQPIGSWTYFDTSIAQSIADNRAALTIPEARSQGPPSFIDQQAAIKAEARRRVLAEEPPDGLPN
jgi:hypothetical protein